MNKIKEFAREYKWGLAILLMIAISFGIFTQCKNNGDKIRAAKEKARKPITTAQMETEKKINPLVAQPAEIISSGGIGINYSHHSDAPTPQAVVIAPPPPPIEEKKLAITPLILVDEPMPTPVPTPTTEPKKKNPKRWLPMGWYIPCILQNTILSSHADTPVEGIVMEDIVAPNHGKANLIIRAGSTVIAMAKPGYIRDRIVVAGEWRVIFVGQGTQVKIQGIACEREYDPSTNQYGDLDKSSGIMGEVIQTDHYVFLRNLLGWIVTTLGNGIMSAGGQVVSSALSGGAIGTGSSFTNLSGASQILDQYVNKLVNGNATDSGINDTILVRVRAGQTFYVWNTSNVYPDEASVEVEGSIENKDNALSPGNFEKMTEKLFGKLFQNDMRTMQQPNPGGTFNNEKNSDIVPMHFGS